MERLGTVVFRGVSGKDYTFDVHDLNGQLGEAAAIYVVTHAYSNGGKIMHAPIYVGQTDNLRQRFAGHHKQACFNSKNANRLCVIKEVNATARTNAETDLINGIKPICNDTI